MTARADWLKRNLILVMGKGGVGKTAVAHAAARHLASQGKRVLLVHVLQLSDEEQRLELAAPNLWEITLRASDCFREYIMLKLRVKALYTAFLGNKITQYLERAAPGVREMVLLGKIWYERDHYDHVIVDMPSTGYALTMIHTPFNFAALFPGGPIYNDAKHIIASFSEPDATALVTVSLAEEMPIQESTELAAELLALMPRNPSWLVVNRLIRLDEKARHLHKHAWKGLSDEERASPLWRGLDHLVARERSQAGQLAALKETWAPYRKPWMEIGEIAEKDEGRRSSRIAGLIEGRGHEA
jgi:hypothetical protein